jgi:2'-5' RNA ligase
MLRTFLAIDLPAGQRPTLERLTGELKKSGAQVKWVPVGNVHLTLKFFGDVSEAQAVEIARVAAPIAQTRSPFQLRLSQAGAFPTLRSPRVVWVGLAGELGPLKALHQELEIAFEGLGFPREDRAFAPHLTLGRVKSSQGREGLVRHLAVMPAINGEPFWVREIVLFRSTLTPTGAIYTPLKVMPLGGNH